MNEEKKKVIIELMREAGAVVGYLFGSYARGTAGALSDLDVAVAFPMIISENEQENRIENIRGNLEKIYGKDKVDVINVPRLKNPLLRYIITLGEGKVLFSDDRSLLNRLAHFALTDYEDTKPLRAIQGEALKKLFI
ncbi:MAG: nucleotidyltransferase domain-containing protein [Candidatus Taylorbacteria bacterium]|nr:nucleotidyltransferase domain-containing protein [Candidatus Taylorbacteria bacterium]